MADGRNRVCPVEMAAGLDSRFRRWLQSPRKILSPFVKEGMTVLDFGCGPGYFTIEIARMVGKSGRVIAADLQDGMLQRIRNKIRGSELEQRITLCKCEKNKLSLSENVDFVLAFYMVHEVPNQDELFRDIESILKPAGQVLVVEPPFHVSKVAFEQTVGKARNAGLTPVDRPKVFLSKAVILRKG